MNRGPLTLFLTLFPSFCEQMEYTIEFVLKSTFQKYILFFIDCTLSLRVPHLLVVSGSGEKKFLPHFFNIASMGKKLISKNHLTPPPPPFLLRFRLKINKNQGMILGKFQSGSRPGTWCSRGLKFSKEEHR